MPDAVLDASAVLVYLRGETGSDRVAEYLAKGSFVSAVNWCEVLSKLSDVGLDPADVESELQKVGILGFAIEVLPFEQEDALTAAQLRSVSRKKGLSLGDRACLSVGIKRQLTVVTADRSWEGIISGITIEVIR